MSADSKIVLYTAATPNGRKISILLEELGLKYETKTLSFKENEQKEPWFLEINPNGRIPALTDTFADGKQIRLFESGSIMQYLIETYDKEHKVSYPAGSREYYETNNWLFFQNAGVGPMQGQANHFNRYAPEKLPYAIDRYLNETRRLFRTMDKHLQDTGSEYLVGSKATVADFATWPWVVVGPMTGVPLDEFPTLSKWVERLWDRPGLNKGQAVPSPIDRELLKDPKAADAAAAAKAKEGSAWILKGMQDDSKK